MESPAPALFAEAIGFLQSGRRDEAAARLREVLRHDPNHADALHILGGFAHEAGQGEVAVALISRAITAKPGVPVFHDNLGLVLQSLGAWDEALAEHRRALALDPRHLPARRNLAMSLRRVGRFAEAAEAYRAWLALDPGAAEGINDFGNVLENLGRLPEALAAYRHAIAIRPTLAEAHANLANLLEAEGALTEAIATCERAIALKPTLAEAHNNLGKALRAAGRAEEAVIAFRRALALAPEKTYIHGNLMVTLHYAEGYGGADFLAEARAFAGAVEPAAPAIVHANDPDPTRRLRIGFVSADFRNHPVGYFLPNLLAARDPAAIEVFCYDNGMIADRTTERLCAIVDHWRPVAGLSDEAAADLITSDVIDILIDLSGHTAGNRLPLFARRPAPIQATWLGYVGTTGLTAMDYILADRFVVKRGEEGWFTEQVWRLPESYLCFTPPDIRAPIIERPTGARLTLGCFNNWAKVGDSTIALWSEILKRLPDAELLLKTHALRDPSVRQSALDRFARHGVAPERILLEGSVPRAELLAAYNRVDIALDPLPYGGGLTTLEALWMGVPVATLVGDHWAGRHSESILATIGGLEDLIARDAAEHVEQVAILAADGAGRATLRRELRGRLEVSPLCDGPRAARELEAALRAMWAGWRAGRGAE